MTFWSPFVVAQGRPISNTLATYTVTTVGAAVHTIFAFGVVALQTCRVWWGDGTFDDYVGAAMRTHNYASAGTWTVTIENSPAVETFDIRDNKVNLNSATIAPIINVRTFIAETLRSGTFNSSDVSGWRPTTFAMTAMPAGYAGTFNSVDVSGWRPTIFYLYSMPAGYAGTFNSADVSAWRPTSFYLYSMPAGYAGTFNSADVSGWLPTTFYLRSMPAGYAGTFNSVDVSGWRPVYFYLYSMPAGYAGTFNSVDVSAWRPVYFYLYSMPAGYVLMAGGGFANWTPITYFQVQSNALLQATVDAILWELYQASVIPRTGVAGTINIGGTNAAPSGVYQAAAACPVNGATPGKEVAHELRNDGCAVGFNKWATVTFTP